jgi:hypothetical protein
MSNEAEIRDTVMKSGVSQDTANKLIQQFGVGLADAAAIYIPAIYRLTTNELMSWIDLVMKKDQAAATQVLRDKMTPEELTVEKTKLAALLQMMADNNAEKWQVGQAVTLAILRAGLSAILVPGVLL